jgi:hypothetical protein
MGGWGQPRNLINSKRLLTVDRIMGGIVTIDVLHQAIHLKLGYSATSVHTALADNASVQFTFKKADVELHLTTDVAAGGDALLTFLEGGVTSSSGTTVNLISNNRKRPLEVSGTSMWFGNSYSLAGTTLTSTYLPGGTKNAATGGQQGGREEFITNKNTIYTMKIQNIAGSAKTFGVHFEWYEED